MNYTAEYPLKPDGISKSILFIEEKLKEFRVKQRDLLEALLISEETMLLLEEHAPEDANIKVTVTRNMGVSRIRLIVPGKPLELDEHVETVSINSWEKKRRKLSAVPCCAAMPIQSNINTAGRETKSRSLPVFRSGFCPPVRWVRLFGVL